MSNPDPPPVQLNPIHPILFNLVDCLCTELTENGAGPTCWCGIYPGAAVSLEYCNPCGNDACGMGWVRVMGTTPSDTFPVPTLDPTCRKELAWMVEVGAARCIPVPEDGEIPSPAEMLEVAVGQMQDQWAIYRALMCCGAPSVVTQQWLPIGPDGGCVGGYWVAFLGVT